MQYQKVILLALLLIVFKARSQEDLKPSLIPPSPDAAAMVRYGNFQFSHYTGTPQISIPLYEVRSNDVSVPITLSYDASGVKVSQQASWVGLNWTLNTGGVITRSVRSLLDENGVNSYKTLSSATISQITSGTIMTGTTLATAKNIANKIQDGEPDLYFFSFNGRAGKFIETADGYFVLDRAELKIEKSSGWIITDENGFKFYFRETEDIRPNNYKETRDFTSSWYLTQIESPNGTKIEFFYKSVGVERTPSQFTKSYDVNFNLAGYPSYIDNNRTNIAYSYILNKKVLERIVLPNSEVYFSTESGRLDVQKNDQYGEYSPGHFLTSIEVRSASGEPFKHFKFLYSYFQNGSNSFANYRLKLDKIIEAPNGQSILNIKVIRSHQFEYYDPNGLPSVTSEAQDHWGYATNRGNTLLPTFDLAKNKLLYESRDASETAVTAGTLKKIIFPTGGHAEFVYEPHSYSYVAADVVNEDILQPGTFQVNAQKPEDPGNQRYSVAYSTLVPVDALTKNINIHIDFNFTQLPNAHQLRIDVIKPQFPLGAERVIENMTSFTVIKSFIANSESVSQALNLSTGDYFIKAVAEVVNTSVQAEVRLEQKTGVRKVKLAGGLRIHKFLQYDPISNQYLTKKFSYKDVDDPDRSSGVLVTPVQYEILRSITTGELIEPQTGLRKPDMINDCEADLVKRWKEIRSSNIFPLGETSGSHIGYKRVIIEDVDVQGGTGSTIETYTGANTFPDEPKRFVGSSGENNDMYRGKMLHQLILDSSGKKIKEIINKYDFHVYKYFPSLVLSAKYQMINSAASLHICAFDFAHYNNVVGKALLIKQTVNDYNENGDSVKNEITYQYDKKSIDPIERAHTLVTSETKTTSKGDVITSNYLYAIDNTSDEVLNTMFDRHIIAPRVQQRDVMQGNGKILFNRRYIYNLFNNTPLLERIEQSFSAAAPISVLKISKYDDLGRILQMQDIAGVLESYVWDPSSGKPIAKLLNAAHGDVYINDFENSGVISNAHTGYKSSLSGLTISLGSLRNGQYELCYWENKNGSWVMVKNEVIVQNNTYTISIAGHIDNVRFYPISAQLTSFTYNKAHEISATIDPNGLCTFYEYDGLQRLILIKDNNGSVIKTFNYNLVGH